VGLRFRKRIRLFKGFTLNLSKKGLSSLSIGPRRLTTNISDRGARETIGLPKSGIYYVTKTERPGNSSRGASRRHGQAPLARFWQSLWHILF
jgi:uncharacterized protein DUF4236